MMKGMVCVLDIDDFSKAIMEEAYCSAYTIIRVVPKCIELSRKIIGGLI